MGPGVSPGTGDAAAVVAGGRVGMTVCVGITVDGLVLAAAGISVAVGVAMAATGVSVAEGAACAAG